jgi:hypothetical protein
VERVERDEISPADLDRMASSVPATVVEGMGVSQEVAIFGPDLADPLKQTHPSCGSLR